jgi:hypothetical protein
MGGPRSRRAGGRVISSKSFHGKQPDRFWHETTVTANWRERAPHVTGAFFTIRAIVLFRQISPIVRRNFFINRCESLTKTVAGRMYVSDGQKPRSHPGLFAEARRRRNEACVFQMRAAFLRPTARLLLNPV